MISLQLASTCRMTAAATHYKVLLACQHMPVLNMLASHTADRSAAEGKLRTTVLCLLETM